MLREMIADARSNGFQIVPLCPFVNAQRRKHPEWADAFSV
jgi:predicted GNAT family acetyltransferase